MTARTMGSGMFIVALDTALTKTVYILGSGGHHGGWIVPLLLGNVALTRMKSVETGTEAPRR